MCVCVCACGRERELSMLPTHIHTVRISAPDRNMGEQPWDSILRVDDEAEQSIDFKHRKCEFPIAAKVRAAKCWLMSKCVFCSVLFCSDVL